MKMRLFCCFFFCSILGAATASAAASYTKTIPAGFSAIGNQLSNGGNTADVIFPNPNGFLDGDEILKYVCAGTYVVYVFDSSSPTGFTDPGGNPLPAPTLLPGEGVYFVNAIGAFTATFTGTPVVPVLPASLLCGCDQPNFLARQTDGSGTYENVTGYQPTEGAQVQRFNGLGLVTNTYAGGAWSLGAPTVLNVGEAAFFVVPCRDKWVVPPDTSTNGLDVQAVDSLILADDFLCSGTGPISEIRVRGSWRNDNVSTQACFWVGIWSDVPRQGTNASHPGVRLCNYLFNPGQYTYSLYATGLSERFYNPDRTGTNGLIGSDTSIWEYVFFPPINAPCIQTNGNVYWLSVHATCFDTNQFLFGWKTYYTNWNDDAVFGHTAGIEPPLGDWKELRRPGATNSLDLSFTIKTAPPVPLITLDNFDTNKWLQPPDTSTNGLDVRATHPKILADDFLCTASGPITQVRVWGSWRSDQRSDLPCFCLGIWSDVPRQGTNYSRPGSLLCDNCFTPGQYTYFIYTNPVSEQFFDPNIPAIVGNDTVIWEYVFDWPADQQCVQTISNIYWLSLWANCFDTNFYLFGWKTSPYNWNDDAVFGHAGPGGVPLMDWHELRRPPLYSNSLDLAFEIITSPPTNKWFQIPDTNYTGLDVRATKPKMLADDFRCDLTGPITDIKIWGSWLWDFVPPVHPHFCLGLWTDVPAQGTNHSHPGTLICTNCFYPFQYTNFPYASNLYEQFFDPNLPGIIGSDTVIWEYDFKFTNNPCWQTNGHTYWLSLWADGFDTNYYVFGWKTCPTNWNDDAVFGHLSPFDYPLMDWHELRRPPLYSNSLDLAFQIITGPTNPPPRPPQQTNKWLQPPDSSTNGIDVEDINSLVLADDFLCAATGPINMVRLWGSWLNDIDSPNIYFNLGIWTDVPRQGTNASHPGQLLCNVIRAPGQYARFHYTNVFYERFFDPSIPALVGTDTNIWEYLFNLGTNCWQTNGNVYWLSVWTSISPTTNLLFGWKTSPTNWNDDAVYAVSGDPSIPIFTWHELRRPPFYTNSLDLAFELVTGTNLCPASTIICSPNKTVECGTGWSLDDPVVIDACCGPTNYIISGPWLAYTNPTGNTCTQTLTYFWFITNCFGVFGSCTQTVTVRDTTPPVLVCASNKCTTTWTFDPPTVSDLCCGTNVTVTILSTITNTPCQATRTWRATDCCSNSATCSQTIFVNDTNAPIITCSNILVVTCNSNVQVNWSLSATDTCSFVTVTSSPPSGTFFNRGTTNTVIAVATDACGHTNSCFFLVMVRKPLLNIAPGTTHGTIVVSWVDGGVLEEAGAVLGPWSSLPSATSPWTNAAAASQKFYRLRCP